VLLLLLPLLGVRRLSCQLLVAQPSYALYPHQDFLQHVPQQQQQQLQQLQLPASPCHQQHRYLPLEMSLLLLLLLLLLLPLLLPPPAAAL
jgi:hypothetical protein